MDYYQGTCTPAQTFPFLTILNKEENIMANCENSKVYVCKIGFILANEITIKEASKIIQEQLDEMDVDEIRVADIITIHKALKRIEVVGE